MPDHYSIDSMDCRRLDSKNFQKEQIEARENIVSMKPATNDIRVREYTIDDRETVLNLLRLNTPHYFSPEEEKYLVHYLDHEIEFYYVIEVERQIVGCGGINVFEEENLARISWDFLHPEFQGKGLGTKLLEHRIEKIQSMKHIKTIIVRTSQMAYKFYEKSDFQLTELVKNYWAEGFDLYKMEYTKL